MARYAPGDMRRGYGPGYGPEIWNWDMKLGYGPGIWNRDMELGYGTGIWNWDMELGYGPPANYEFLPR